MAPPHKPKEFQDLSTLPVLKYHTKKDGTLFSPRGLTDEVFEQLLDATRAGAGLNIAAQVVGISPWTVRRWLREAAILESQGADPDSDIRLRLAFALPKARAERAVTALKQLEKAAQDPRYWTAAAWYLERTYPEIYGRQDRAPLDWKEELRKMGISPEKAMEEMIAALSKEADEAGPDDVVDAEIVSGTED